MFALTDDDSLRPGILNFTCDHFPSDGTAPGAGVGGDLFYTPGHVIKLIVIGSITVLIIVFNILTICILHSSQYARMRELPKNLMTALALTDLSMGVCVTPVCFWSLLYRCFPLPLWVCKIQALLISSLFHASSLLLIAIAVDRYICINYPLRYRSIMTKKVHHIMALASWLYSFLVYSILVVPHSAFNFDATGLFNCEPFYNKDRSIIIVAFALFFLPSILVIFYCYTAIFFVAHRQLRQIRRDSVNGLFVKFENNQWIKEKKKLYSSLIILSAISIGFLVAIAPWTLTTTIQSLWELHVNDTLEFVVTWIAISNSFWNPILYGLLNKHFRLSCHDFCCRWLKMISFK